MSLYDIYVRYMNWMDCLSWTLCLNCPSKYLKFSAYPSVIPWRPGARVENGAPLWQLRKAGARQIFTTKSRFRANWALLSTILNTYFRDRVIRLSVILTYFYYQNNIETWKIKFCTDSILPSSFGFYFYFLTSMLWTKSHRNFSRFCFLLYFSSLPAFSPAELFMWRKSIEHRRYFTLFLLFRLTPFIFPQKKSVTKMH